MPYQPYPFMAPYDNSRSTSRIVDLMLRQGESRAQDVATRGDIWGNAIANIGQNLGQATGAYFQRRSEEKAEQKFNAERDATLTGLTKLREQLPPAEWAAEAYRRLPADMADKYVKGIQGVEEAALSVQQLRQALAKGDREAEEAARQRATEGFKHTYNLVDAIGGPTNPTAAKELPALLPLVEETFGINLTLEQLQQPEVWKAIKQGLNGPPKLQEHDPQKQLINEATGEVLLEAQPGAEKQYMVTVAGPGGQPIKKLVPESQLQQGVQEYVAPPAPPNPQDTEYQDLIADAWANGKAFPSTQEATSAALRSFARRGMPVPRKLGVAEQQEATRTADALQTIEDVRYLYEKVKDKVGPASYRLAELQQKIPGLAADPDFAEFNTMLRSMGNLEIKRITGAQMGADEAVRLLKGMATGDLKREEFEAALRVMERNARRNRDIILYGTARKMGEQATAPNDPAGILGDEDASGDDPAGILR